MGDTSPQFFLDGRVTLHAGNCLDVLKAMPDLSIDSVCTDPPYHLTSIVKRFGANNASPAKAGKTGAYVRASRGFMGKQWDGGDIAFRSELWAEVLRVLKPGGHMVAFSGTRTYHRMACAIEDAGFEVRDQIGWAFGSGFPKSHDAGDGWGTALKPAWEPICLARRPLIGTVAANVLEYGTGALNIDRCRVGTDETLRPGKGELWSHRRVGESSGDRRYTDSGSTNFAAKPGVRGGDPMGRWPANIVHDGSDEVLACFPQSKGAQGSVTGAEPSDCHSRVDNGPRTRLPMVARGDSGSAARFFYSAKADADDRLGSSHPTVKPVNLMQWLVRLITPKGGTVLDCFAGTGTTGAAAWKEGFSSILIEREEEYRVDIARRMALCLAGPEERSRTSIKARLGDLPAGPLFEGLV